MNDNKAKTAFNEAFFFDDLGQHEKALSIRLSLEKKFPKHKLLLIALGTSYEKLCQLEKAEEYYRRAVKLYPKEEIASKFLFHFLWDDDEDLWSENRRDEAFEEIRRFQSISHCEDYMEIVREINDKYEIDEDEEKGSESV